MGKFIDLTGQKFARLTALRRDLSAGSAANGRKVKWICRCDCGNEISAIGKNLVLSNSKSCGCLKAEVTRGRSTTHGRSGSRVYSIWQSMIARCTYPSHATYRFYGAKGVRFSEAWGSFSGFLADMGEPEDGMTLDRIDPAGNYEAGNCRWVAMETQHNNLRKSVMWEGERLSVAEVARRTGLARTSIAKLLTRGMGIQEAVSHVAAHQRT